MEEWQEEAIQLQTNYYETNGEQCWRGIPQRDKQLLRSYIGNTLFGMTMGRIPYVAMRHIYKIIAFRYNNMCYIKPILVVSKPKYCGCNTHFLPSQKVLHVTNDIGNTCYIDQAFRAYKDWNDFLTGNQFPYGQICYPINGQYQTNSEGVVQCEFNNTPVKYFKWHLMFFGSFLLFILFCMISSFVTASGGFINIQYYTYFMIIFAFFFFSLIFIYVYLFCKDARKYGRGCCGPII